MWRSSVRASSRSRALLASWPDARREAVALAAPCRGLVTGLGGVMNCSSHPVGPARWVRNGGPRGLSAGDGQLDGAGPPRMKQPLAPGPVHPRAAASTGKASKAALPAPVNRVQAPVYPGSYAATPSLHVKDPGADARAAEQPEAPAEHAGRNGSGVREELAGRMLLVDGSALLFRAYHKVVARITKHATDAHRESSPDDEDVIGTVLTFLRLLLPLFQLGPTHAAVALDVAGPTFRDELFAGYKARRAPPPDAIPIAKLYVEKALKALGLVVLQYPNVEADDVLATVAQQALDDSMTVRVVSPDKDFFQLLGPRLSLLRHETPSYRGMRSSQHRQTKPEFVEFTEAHFRSKFRNVPPAQHVDILALMGDASDCIPGVKGIGEKSALKLVEQYGSVDAILAGAASMDNQRLSKALLTDKGKVLLWRRLVTLRKDLDLGVPLEDLRLARPKNGGSLFWEFIEQLPSGSVQVPPKLRADVHHFWGSLPPAGGLARSAVHYRNT